jgi:hypothetical protein
MMVVETIGSRANLVHGPSIAAIGRDLGFSRKVVRKVIRSEATEFPYEREARPFQRSALLRHVRSGLLANEEKASRQRLTLIRLFEEQRACLPLFSRVFGVTIPHLGSNRRDGRPFVRFHATLSCYNDVCRLCVPGRRQHAIEVLYYHGRR